MARIRCRTAAGWAAALLRDVSTTASTRSARPSPAAPRGRGGSCAHRCQRLAHELFVGVRTVYLGGIEECDTAFHGRADERDHRRFVRWDTVALAHPHAAEPEGRDFEIALSKFAVLHASLL